MKIKNMPEEASNYEFIVAYTNERNQLVYNSHFKDGFEAEKKALEIPNSVVIHNVRIQGYKEPVKNKFYTISGTWYWTCYASSKTEAKSLFKENGWYDVMLDDDFTIEEEEA